MAHGRGRSHRTLGMALAHARVRNSKRGDAPLWVIAALLAAFSAADCQAQGSWWEDQDEDGEADTLFVDEDGNGVPEKCIVDLDEDGNPEIMYLDVNQDGDWDHRFEDTDDDGKWDRAELDCVDTDDEGDGDDDRIDSWWLDKDGDGQGDPDEYDIDRATEPGPLGVGPGSIWAMCGDPIAPPCTIEPPPVSCPVGIPTMSETGLIVFALLLSTIGLLFLTRR